MLPIESRPFALLMVEDNPADVIWLKHILAQTKFLHTMVVAHDGEFALEFLKKKGPYASALEPDLVLLDIHLPKVSGLEVLEQIRCDQRLQDLPVCITTG